MSKAQIIPLLIVDEEKVYDIGKRLLGALDIGDDRDVINSLSALAHVAASLAGTLDIIREDLGNDCGEKEFLRHLSKPSKNHNFMKYIKQI
ncbi:MAG: hypothetical protein E7103_10080 [Prevotella sp.]|nr:hypothetical protein [Prevotella sp.]